MHFSLKTIAAVALVFASAEAVPRNVAVAGRSDVGVYRSGPVGARAAAGSFAMKARAVLNARQDEEEESSGDSEATATEEAPEATATGGDSEATATGGDEEVPEETAPATATGGEGEVPEETAAPTATGGGDETAPEPTDAPTATGEAPEASAPAETGEAPAETGGASAPAAAPTGGSSSGGSSTGNSTAGSGTMPASAGQSTLSEPMIVTGEFDGGMATFDRGVECTGQSEGGDADAVFDIQEGGTLRNVIIGAAQKEGVHCQGSCTLENVWWEAVCEDAFTIKKQSADGVTTITGGGASGAEDKVLQHNGGGTLKVSGFTVDNFGKLYRSCGNCKESVARHVELDGVTATGGTSTVIGINPNFGDTAKITNSCLQAKNICEEFEGTTPGNEPTSVSTGASDTCVFTDADINAC